MLRLLDRACELPPPQVVAPVLGALDEAPPDGLTDALIEHLGDPAWQSATLQRRLLEEVAPGLPGEARARLGRDLSAKWEGREEERIHWLRRKLAELPGGG